MEWISWSNAAYMVAIMLGGYITFAANKYKKVLKEIQEALETYHQAMKDGKLTDAEKDKLIKEVLDIAQAGIRLFW